jgi:hypothetical protein
MGFFVDQLAFTAGKLSEACPMRKISERPEAQRGSAF